MRQLKILLYKIENICLVIVGIKIYTYICIVDNHSMPTIFEIFGLRFFFFSGDHAPIHVHVVKGDDDAKIAIIPEIKLVYNNGLKVGDLR